MEMQSIMDEVAELRQELDRVKKKNGFLEQQLQELINDKEKTLAKLKEYQNALRVMQERYQNDSNIKKLTELEEENKELKERISTLQEIVKSLQEENENLKNKLKKGA